MDDMLEVFGRPDFFEQLVTHIELSVLGLAIGLAIALPLAILVNRSPVLSNVAINFANVGRAIPSLAILAFAFPLLGLGFKPALVALALLCVPPILINAVTGLRQVSPQIVDAARGMGLSGGQILGRIQVPIAAPVIFAGVRTSAVQVVASATLATFIGGGGLGDFIVEGFQRGQYSIMVAGALSVAVLAIITEVSFGVLEWAFTPKGLRIAQKRRAK